MWENLWDRLYVGYMSRCFGNDRTFLAWVSKAHGVFKPFRSVHYRDSWWTIAATLLFHRIFTMGRLLLLMMLVCLLGPQGHGSEVLCWTHLTLLPQSAWLLEEETFNSWQVSLRENYCCSMEMGILSSPMPWTEEIYVSWSSFWACRLVCVRY